MKCNYIEPEMDMIVLNPSDIVTASNETEFVPDEMDIGGLQ